MPDTLIQGVSDTAFWIAHYRAVETTRPDALFRDPLAASLAGARGKRIADAMPTTVVTGWSVAIRTIVIDDYIRSAIARGIDMVLNLGAGLDTRPYRMDLPASLIWIEADYPGTVEYKAQRLAAERPHCRLERVGLDLADLSARRDLLARADARAQQILVLTEGVIPYLTVEEVGALADDLRVLAHTRYWVVDYFAPAIFKYRQRLLKGRMRNAPFRFNPDDWFGFFAAHGWSVGEMRYLAEEGERLHRPIQLPFRQRMSSVVRWLLASPEQRARFRRFAGYAMLERHDIAKQPGGGRKESDDAA